MTKLKIQEKHGVGNVVDARYPFEDITAGDMFYNYDMDWLVMTFEVEAGDFALVELTSGEVVTNDDDGYFEDTFERLTKVYGDWYPVSKAKLKFTVGE